MALLIFAGVLCLASRSFVGQLVGIVMLTAALLAS